MPSKHILLVDDERSVTRMMRAALDTLGRDYIVVAVPSGEEAVLEIGRGGVDLLITDVRLPGMSGLEVIKRLRRMDSKAQAIVITGQANPQNRAEAERLGVSAYFTKPITMDNFLNAVQSALGEKPSEPAAPAAAEPASPGAGVQLAEEQQGSAERLTTLRRDLGANAVFVVDRDGKVIMSAGDLPQLDTREAFKHLMAAFDAAMKLSRLIGGFIPSNVHFFDGDDFDIYAANVGQYFALVIVFDGDRGAGQMGPVMRYGRQCADDLLNLLVTAGGTLTPGVDLATPSAIAPTPARPAPPPPAPALDKDSPIAAARAAAAAKAAVPPPPKAPVMEEKPAPPPLKPLSEAEFKALEEALAKSKAAAKEAASFWDAAVEEETAKPPGEEELKALDAALDKTKAAPQDADSFWEAATGEDAAPPTSGAISFEEAERLGLVPKK